MLDTDLSFDSMVAMVPEAALVLDTGTDRIAALNAPARRFLGDAACPGQRFSDLLGPDLARFIVFIQELDHRGAAWTREIDLRTDAGPVRCEMRARRIGPDPATSSCCCSTLPSLSAAPNRWKPNACIAAA